MRYECHVTIEYVEAGTTEHQSLCDIAKAHGFRVAKLYKSKGVESDLDTFMTGHSDNFGYLRGSMQDLIFDLERFCFNVNRYKIEEILLDSRNGD